MYCLTGVERRKPEGVVGREDEGGVTGADFSGDGDAGRSWIASSTFLRNKRIRN